MQAKTRGPAPSELKGVPQVHKAAVASLLQQVRTTHGLAHPVNAARTINLWRDIGVRANKPLGRSRSGLTYYKITHQGSTRSGLVGCKISYVNHIKYVVSWLAR